MDSTLTSGANYTENGGPNPVTKVQYLLSFNNNCDVSYWVDHLIDVPDAIKNAFPATPSNDTRPTLQKQISVNAGDLLGYSNQEGRARFDFGALNLRGPETILTTDPRYKDDPIVKTSDKYRHAVCAYQFFASSKMEAYKALFDATASPDQQIIDDLCKDL